MESLRLFNTASRRVDPLVLPADQPFGFYCCGPTVYGPAHIGNFRTFTLQDTMRRVLELAFSPENVLHVRNITDVDDKTIRDARKAGLSLREFTAGWTSRFHLDCERLNLLKPHHEPRATDHIPEQIQLIEQLIARGHAYPADGSVYFRVQSYPAYGQLARLDLAQLQTQDTTSAGAANLADEYDRDHVADFALWKAHKEEEGDNFWDSPWGRGRPGWHLECSAMSHRYLGDSFSLHSGGIDLCFPHHENEIAQSRCGYGGDFARHWMHCVHLHLADAKMSKSLGNLITVDALLRDGFNPAAIRLALLSGHYRQPLNFSVHNVESAHSAVEKIHRQSLLLIEKSGFSADDFITEIAPRTIPANAFAEVWKHLANDLNTPAAIGALFTALKSLSSRPVDPADIRSLARIYFALGLPAPSPAKPPEETRAPAAIHEIAEKRWQAKTQRDWTTADALRKELLQLGWTVIDKKEGYQLTPNPS